MASVNKVILIGNLGSDPDVKYLDSGSAVAKFSIATTESYNNKHGERIENTEWHRIELWEGLAKVAEKYLNKGSQVYIEGKLKTDKWTDKEGVERSAVTIRGTSLTMLGGAGNPRTPAEGLTNGANPAGARAQRASDPIPPSLQVNPDEEDDLPF